MKILETAAAMLSASRQARRYGKRLGFVPTMGALHEGHLSLVRAARKRCDAVAVSIFVNPTQFAPHEDFSIYPHDLERDRALLENEHVDFLFAPAASEIYPGGSATWVSVDALADRLCGKSRPGHFRAVATVVAKLFHIVEPDIAVFGQKDAVQVAVIRRMIRDLNFPIELEACPIVREPDGLAMSSRNAYLASGERRQALVLRRSLLEVERQFDAGERDSATLIAAATKIFAAESEVRLDYFEIVDPATLIPLPEITNQALVAVAAHVGATRLIDNITLSAQP
ncbi:MAG: pantoate--beta-alanine ligase [Candidatus Acidiferrales bacterium]